MIIATIIVLLGQMLSPMEVEAPEPEHTQLEQWADAIETFENMPDDRNNPGALRYSPYATGEKNGYATFDTYEQGRQALLFQLTIATDGRSKVYNPEMTLLEFYEKYSPSSDGNNPKQYASFVASYLGVDIDTKIKELSV